MIYPIIKGLKSTVHSLALNYQVFAWIFLGKFGLVFPKIRLLPYKYVFHIRPPY